MAMLTVHMLPFGVAGLDAGQDCVEFAPRVGGVSG